MNAISRAARLLPGLALVLAVLAVAASVSAAGRPEGMSPAAYQALMLRSQALNEFYGLPAPAAETQRADRLRGQALNTLYGNAFTRMTPDEFRAVYTRGSWLNENARRIWPVSTPAAVTRTLTGDGFDWADAAIGAAVAAGVALLVLAGATLARRHGHALHLHRPLPH